VIRPARWSDRAQILRLILAMGGHEGVARGADPLRALGEILTQAESRALVAERDGRVVGFADVHARVASADDRREAWLGALCVAEDARRSGVAGALIAAAEREARLLGCATLVLESSEWRAEAHAFYRALGFAEKAAARRFVRDVSLPGGTLEERFLAAAAEAASAVKAAIVELGRRAPVGIGADGAQTEAADRAAETAALGVLLPLGLPVVSEEAGLVGADSIDPSTPWISLDPLDGSRNFVAGYPYYAISMGLVVDGRPRAGMVVDLDGGHRWWALAGAGAWRDGRPIRARASALIGVPSPPAGAGAFARFDGYARIRISGSSALDLCCVADGSLGAFVSLERPVVHVHDLAGALPVILEAGGAVLDRDGELPELAPDPAACRYFAAAADRASAEALLLTAPRQSIIR
jgi:3'(2'), 5'-bisphosphate nucleotidase